MVGPKMTSPSPDVHILGLSVCIRGSGRCWFDSSDALPACLGQLLHFQSWLWASCHFTARESVRGSTFRIAWQPVQEPAHAEPPWGHCVLKQVEMGYFGRCEVTAAGGEEGGGVKGN